MAAVLHWHGYSWMGSSAELKDESLRRPGKPGIPQWQAFIRGTLPPLQTGYYLLRRPGSDLTWTDPDKAIGWLVERYQQHTPSTREDGGAAYVPLDQRVVTSRDGLVNAVDAWWQYYTPGMGQALFAAICCPHAHLSDLPCPVPPRT